MQNINSYSSASAASYESTPVEKLKIIDSYLQEIDDEIDSHTRKAKEKGIDVNSSAWFQEMQSVKNRAKASMQELIESKARYVAVDCILIVGKSFQELESIQSRLDMGALQSEKKHASMQQRHGSFQSSISSGTLELVTSATLKKRANQDMPADLKKEFADDIKDTMGTVRLVSAGLGLIGDALLVIPCGTADSQTRESCRCVLQSAAKVGKTVLEAIGLKEPVKDLLQGWKSLNMSSAVDLLMSYDVPEAEAMHLAGTYAEDLKHLSIASIPLGTIATLAKRGVSTLGKTAAAAENAVAKSYVKATNQNGSLDRISTISDEINALLNSMNSTKSGSIYSANKKLNLSESLSGIKVEKVQSLSVGELVYTSETSRIKAAANNLKATSQFKNHYDNPSYKRAFAESQKREAAKQQNMDFKKQNGLIHLEQKVARQQRIAEGYKQDRQLLSQLSKERPIHLSNELSAAFKDPSFISNMHRTPSTLLHTRVGNDTVYFIPHNYTGGSLQRVTEMTSKGVNGRSFIAFDPQTHSLRDVNLALKEVSKPIEAIGRMPRGDFNPLIIIEILKGKI